MIMGETVPFPGPVSRMSALDVVQLQPHEAYAILVHLSGDPNPVIAQAVTDATQFILERTRGGGAD
jgi:hypothetical protein